MKVMMEVSPGDLIDRITILEIKTERIQEADLLNNVRIQLDILRRTFNENIEQSEELQKLIGDLKNINKTLWGIEEELRVHERHGNFDGDFIALARAVYKTNDRRAVLKNQIDVLLSAKFSDVKSYKPY